MRIKISVSGFALESSLEWMNGHSAKLFFTEFEKIVTSFILSNLAKLFERIVTSVIVYDDPITIGDCHELMFHFLLIFISFNFILFFIKGERRKPETRRNVFYTRMRNPI